MAGERGRKLDALIVTPRLIRGQLIQPVMQVKEDRGRVTSITRWTPSHQDMVALSEKQFFALVHRPIGSFDRVFMYMQTDEPRLPLEPKLLEQLDPRKTAIVVSAAFKEFSDHGKIMATINAAGFQESQIIDPGLGDPDGSAIFERISAKILKTGDYLK